MERARVFIAEDEAQWRSTIEGLVEDAGHTVVGSAKTKQEALSAVMQFGNLGVQVATLDANLDDPADDSGNDGQEVLAAIRAGAPEVKTIGAGASSRGFPGVDVDLGKGRLGKIGDVINKL